MSQISPPGFATNLGESGSRIPRCYWLIFLIVSFARIYKTVHAIICTADDHVKIACKEGASKL